MAGEQYEILLAWQKAHLTVEAAEGLTTDMVIKAVWENIPIGLTDGAIQWAKTNRKTVTTPPVEYKDFTGTWRLMRCETPLNPKTGLKTLAFYYAKGWITSLASGATIDFTYARLAEKQPAGRTLTGNTSTIAGVTNTTSDNPEKYVLVEWPNCSADHSAALIGHLNVTSVTTLSADGQLYAGTYHVIYGGYRKEDDGSITMYAMFAQPQYTLNAYDYVSTIKGKTKTYLWGVPKDLAQGILDSYGATSGRSASCSYNTDQGVVDMILLGATTTSDSYTSPTIKNGCDHYMIYYLGWGMTKAQLDAFLLLHDGITTPDTYSVTREISIQEREDGLFNVIIKESWFGPHANPATPDLTFDLPVGTVTVETYNYGWNLRLSEMASVTVLYDKDDVPAVAGQRRILRITRRDDCSFDYEGIFIVYGERTATLATSNTDGIETSIQNVKFAAALPASPVSAHRKRYRLDADQNEVGTFDYTIASETVEETVDADIETSGAAGINTKMRYGKNQDAEPAITKAKRKRINGSIQANDDGTIDHNIIEQTVVASEEDYNVGNIGENVHIDGGQNADTLADPTTPITKGVTKQLQFDFDDDGTIHYKLVTITKVEQEIEISDGTYLTKQEAKIAINDVTHADADFKQALGEATAVVAEGVSVQMQMRVDDDGTVQRQTIKITSNDEDTVSYPLTTARFNPLLNKDGYKDVAIVFRNIRIAALVDGVGSIGLHATEYGEVHSLRMNEDRTFDAVKVLRTYFNNTAYTAVTFSKEDVTYNEIYHHFDGDLEEVETWWFTSIEDKWFDDYGDAVNHAAAGYHSNTRYNSRLLEVMKINGKEWWHAIKFPTPSLTAPP